MYQLNQSKDVYTITNFVGILCHGFLHYLDCRSGPDGTPLSKCQPDCQSFHHYSFTVLHSQAFQSFCCSIKMQTYGRIEISPLLGNQHFKSLTRLRHRVDTSGLGEETGYQEEGKQDFKPTSLVLQTRPVPLLSLIFSDNGRTSGISCKMLPVPYE